MQTDVVTVHADLSLKIAARMLLEENTAACPWSVTGGCAGSSPRPTLLRLTMDLMDAVEPEED